MTQRLDYLIETFQHWLYLPDPSPLLAVLGTVAANRLEGTPVWLLLVGPSSTGKSEILQATAELEDVHPAATITEAALLSGSSLKDRSKRSSGGLLRTIGEFGILLCKDFTSVLSMHREARQAVLAALREIHDGQWTRHLGTDGGLSFEWEGKLGLLGGCTPSIDSHHTVMATMGERFILFRMPELDEDRQAEWALRTANSQVKMRRELSGSVTEFFRGFARLS
jgi:hypothetical protein